MLFVRSKTEKLNFLFLKLESVTFTSINFKSFQRPERNLKSQKELICLLHLLLTLTNTASPCFTTKFALKHFTHSVLLCGGCFYHDASGGKN